MYYLPLIGRLLLSAIFLISGVSKITGFAGQVAYAESVGIPMAGAAIVAAIIVELAGGVALVLGWHIRTAAAALALYTILTALLFHFDFSQQMQQIQFLKNMAIAGGLFYVLGFGAGTLSLESKGSQNKNKTMDSQEM